MHLIVVKLAAIGDLSISIHSLSLIDLSAVKILDIITDNELVPLACHLVEHWALGRTPSTNHQNSTHNDPRPLVRVHGVHARALFNKQGRFNQVKAFFKLRGLIGDLKHAQTDTETLKTLVLVMHRDQRYRLLGADGILGHSTPQNEYDAQRTFLLEYFPSRILKREHPDIQTTDATNLAHQANELKIGIFIGGGQNTKTQFTEKSYPRFPELIAALLSICRNSQTPYDALKLSITLLGSQEDRTQAQAIIMHNNAPASITDHTGHYSLPELCEHLRTLDIYIGTDSGPSHLAAQLLDGTSSKVFILFGPTNPKTWAPSFNKNCHIVSEPVPCAPCYQDDGHFKPCLLDNNPQGARFQLCMKQIEPHALARYVLGRNSL